MAVLKETFPLTQSEVGYVTKVGYEEKVQKKRIREVVTPQYYKPSMPMVETAVTNPPANPAKQVNFIVNTGPDLTLIREEVADELGLKAFVCDVYYCYSNWISK